MNDAPTITMETMEDTSLPNDGPSAMVLPAPSPASAGDNDQQGSYPPKSPPPETVTMDLALVRNMVFLNFLFDHFNVHSLNFSLSYLAFHHHPHSVSYRNHQENQIRVLLIL